MSNTAAANKATDAVLKLLSIGNMEAWRKNVPVTDNKSKSIERLKDLFRGMVHGGTRWSLLGKQTEDQVKGELATTLALAALENLVDWDYVYSLWDNPPKICDLCGGSNLTKATTRKDEFHNYCNDCQNFANPIQTEPN